MDIHEKIAKTVITKFESTRKIVGIESRETRDMMKVFGKTLAKKLGKKYEPTEKEMKEAITQLKDVGKIGFLVPFMMMPGSVITVPALVKLGKKYGVDMLPTAFTDIKKQKK